MVAGLDPGDREQEKQTADAADHALDAERDQQSIVSLHEHALRNGRFTVGLSRAIDVLDMLREAAT